MALRIDGLQRRRADHGPNTMTGVEPDWSVLRAAATEAAAAAHAPYSRFPVGAAGLTASGVVLRGCNVENASYGLTLCAECGLVSALRLARESMLVAVSVVDPAGRLLSPCGRCRQVLLEHGGPDLLIDADPEPQRLGVLLPGAFDADELGFRSSEADTEEI
jgi:cytidine deaminase